MLRFAIFLLLILSTPMFARQVEGSKKKLPVNKDPYGPSPYLTEWEWNSLSPYLLPCDHPVRGALDEIFKRGRVTSNCQTLKEAGFSSPEQRQISQIVVTTHPNLQGYLLKFYTDDVPSDDVKMCMNRIEGAKTVRACIEKHKYGDYFTVPKKWIYPLPPKKVAEGLYRHHVVLVEEDMYTFERHVNRKVWRQSMTIDLLKMFYTILNECGLRDSIMPYNVPFCYNGKLAFIDTEYHHQWPIYWSLLTPFLAPALKEPWEQIYTNPH